MRSALLTGAEGPSLKTACAQDFSKIFSLQKKRGIWLFVRAEEHEGGEKEEWHPSSVTPLVVQIGSQTATSPKKCHWLWGGVIFTLSYSCSNSLSLELNQGDRGSYSLCFHDGPYWVPVNIMIPYDDTRVQGHFRYFDTLHSNIQMTI